MAKKKINDFEIEMFMAYGLDISNRIVYIGSANEDISDSNGVNGKLAENAIKSLTILENQNKSPIKIILNGYGGDYYYGMAIYDYLKSCESEIRITVCGPAMSAHSLILQAGDVRSLTKHSKLMIHYGSFGMDDHTKNFKNWSKEAEQCCVELERIYMNKIQEKIPNFKLHKLKKMLDFDSILSAEETVSIGLADEIVNNE